MSGRDEGYYGPSDSDLGRGALVIGGIALAGAVMVTALCLAAVADEDADAGSGGCMAFEFDDYEGDDYEA